MKILSFLFCCSILFIACDSDKPSIKSAGQLSIGKPNELLVVADSTLLKSEFGNQFKDQFEQPYGVLPQPEPFFKLIKIPSDVLNRLLRKSKNILFLVDLENKNRTNNYVINNLLKSDRIQKMIDVDQDYFYFHIKNLWATPQLITVMVGRSNSKLIEGFEKDKDFLLHKLNDFENQVLSKKVLQTKTSPKINERLQLVHKVAIHIPEQFRIGREAPEFTWYMRDIKEGYINIVLYNIPYTDTSNFQLQSIIQNRDSILKKYILGQSEESFMVTENEMEQQIRTTNIDNAYCKEVKGLWRLSKDFMGGPFISYAIYNENTKNILNIEGFVTAPGGTKKKYMKELEAILSTIKLTKEN